MLTRVTRPRAPGRAAPTTAIAPPGPVRVVADPGGLLGLLFLSGSVLVLVALLLPFHPDSTGVALAIIAGLGLAAGVGLILASRRGPLPTWVLVAGIATGSTLIALGVYFAGPTGSATIAIFLTYAAGYSFLYFARATAWGLAGLAVAGYGLALGLNGDPAGWAELVVVGGASVVAGLLIGGVGARLRTALEAERALTVALRDADANKTAFLRGVSHDIKGPLSLAAGLIGLLDQNEDLAPGDLDQLLAGLRRQVGRARQVVDDLLQLDRLTSGPTSLHLADTDLSAVIADAVASLEEDAGRVRFEGVSATAPIDRGRLTRAVANLIHNGLRYSPGSEAVDVEVVRHPDGAVITVSDRGPGVPDHLKQRIFEPFVRGDASDLPTGTGIGLSLVARIADLHGGRVWVDDRPGGGARFGLLVPDTPPAAIATPTRPEG